MSGILHKPIRVDALSKLLARFKPLATTLLSTNLADVISAGGLFLEYQPKLDCRSGRITGVESLVRWSHPVHGIIPPVQFIALAEEAGLIRRLTDWVLARAAKQAAAWHADNLALDVAVNLSAKDLEDPDLPERLHQHCHDAGAEPASIILELTEADAMREAVHIIDVLSRLRLKGFKLAIDDFGTGYSSLVQLQMMPLSELKIDRSFVMQMMTNEDCKVIVEIVIGLARKLGLKSVAEGVEGEGASDSLLEIGCDMIQGFYVSPPMAADEVSRFVRKHQA